MVERIRFRTPGLFNHEILTPDLKEKHTFLPE